MVEVCLGSLCGQSDGDATLNRTPRLNGHPGCSIAMLRCTVHSTFYNSASQAARQPGRHPEI